MSYYDAFAPIYERWSTHMTEDVPFYVELARESDDPLVELAVGTARVAVPVARETGRRVIGFDNSAGMLEEAHAAVEAAGVDVELRQADMRDFELDEPAGLVYCPFRSLLHLPTWADRRRVFERVAGSLKPGGRFAWNAFVFDPLVAAQQAAGTQFREDARVWVDTEYDATDTRIDITVWEREDRSDERKVSLWWIARSEWEGLIDVAGLEVEALYGDFDQRPFDAESREFVWVTCKP
ncbi:MAG: class I SAM-dependent methyltransferase [Actinomycetota bacterium]|nr:class I SAM-dependent methyltransferase [Actinomycetota bacterium]